MPARNLTPLPEPEDDLADITPEDIERARAQFREDAPAGWEDLLDAEPVESDLNG